MHNQYARYAAAAIVIAAVGFGLASLTVLENGASPAYAFDQTVQAMHSVRTVHFKCEPTEGGHPGDIWAEFDPTGRVIRCRVDFPDTEDGPKAVFWHDDKAQIWFKRKNSFVTLADKSVAEHVLQMAYGQDPKLMVSRLQDEQARGLVQIETQVPSAAGQPIMLTATYLPGSGDNRRYVLTIDPDSKMVQQVQAYLLVKGQYESASRTRVLEYNRLIDPAIFNPQLPDDTIVVDQTREDIGLPQGDMTRDQVVTEVARQFFQALVDKDYAGAGQLAGGFPAKALEKALGPTRALQIVSISQPVLVDAALTFHVACVIQVEEAGKVYDRPWTLSVRPVYGHPDRWNVSGGI